MRSYYKQTIWNKLFDVFNVVFMILFMLTILFPFWNQVCISFSDVSTYPVSNITVLPLGFNAEAYQKVFSCASSWVPAAPCCAPACWPMSPALNGSPAASSCAAPSSSPCTSAPA